MNREIKFRAWDNQSDKMWGWEQVKHWTFDTSLWTNYDFMQFTGLLDKAKNEVYEGDLIQTEEIIWEVYFGNNQFDGGKSFGWCIKDTSSPSFNYALDKSILKGIVIGNIYQQ